MPPKVHKASAEAAGAASSQAVLEAPITITTAVAPPAAAEDTRAVSLVHRHVFGLKSSVKGNVHFINEKDGEAQILYPAGHNTILYQADQKVQSRVFPGTEGSEGITALAVSPNRKFLAVCERFQDRASCAIHDINSGKRRRGTLTFADCDATEYVCAAFSAENKFLITQGGPPEWKLVLWSWDKARSQGSTTVSNLTGSAIHECSFSPQDSSLVCVIGDGIFKFFRIQEGNLKPIPNQLSKLREANNQNYVCHAWLHCERLVVCSEAGDVLLFDGGGEFKMVLPCSPAEPRSMLCVAAFSRGFVAGGDGGIVRVYERLDNDAKEMFRMTKAPKLDGATAAGTGGPRAGAVTAIAVSPQEEMLAIATSTAQLLQVPLSGSDLLKAEESGVSDILTSFHSGAILGLDVCVRKPLVVTCGSDKSVRIWNYAERSQEQCKFFLEEAYSVAFHPSGFHLIVGFSDKLRLMNLLMEDMRMYKEIPIKACRECRFSHGGQFFAAVNSNTIVVYKTYTCEVVCNLRGHQSKVRSVCWTADDSRIVSTGADGAACEFDIVTGKRCSDWSQKGTSFSCVIAYTNSDSTQQVNTMYVVGSDKMLKEVQATTLTNYVESSAVLGQLAVASSAKALIAGVAEPDKPGPLRCYSFPLEGDYDPYQAHSAPVSRLRITHDDQVVLSAGDDGCLCIFDLKKKAPLRRDKEPLGFADEILVTKGFLDDKHTSLQELERNVESLKCQIDLQLRHLDSDHKEQIAVLQEKYSEEIEGEKRKHEVLREQKHESEMESAEKIASYEDVHAKQTQELEQSFQLKMFVEVQRYKKLAEDLERERQEWEAQRASLVEDHKVVVKTMLAEFETHEHRNRDDQDRIIKERDSAFKTHSETLAQLEKDADREIEELKEMYEQRLATEKDEKVRLRGQAGIHRKHFDELKRQWQKKKDDVQKEEEKNRAKDERIVTLMKDKDSNEKEIKERDKTIYDKEMRINDLKKQNQELEKFKFVLDYKIKELKAQIDPKTGAIDSMKKQTQAMDDELNDYIRRNKQLALDISQLQMKQRALQEEIKTQKRRLRDDWSLIKRFKFDLSECMDWVHEPKALKESVANLYRKHVQLNVDKLDLDTDMQAEYNRQRDYLEKSVDSLKRKLEKDSQAHRIDNMRIMQENVTLITEINHLRREINALRHERITQETQASGGLRGDAPTTAVQVDRELTMQREEIKALQHHLEELEMTAPRVPSAGGKLPQGTLPAVGSPLGNTQLPENTAGQPGFDAPSSPEAKQLPPAAALQEGEDHQDIEVVEGGDSMESFQEGNLPAEPTGEVDGNSQVVDVEPTDDSLADGPSNDDPT